MTNWKKISLVAVVVTAVGFGYTKSSHRNIPADLRDAVADNGEFDTSIPVFDKSSGNIPEPKAAAVKGINKGYVAGTDPTAGVPTKPIEWIAINGGKFTMGTDSGEKGFEDAKPIHEVAIKTFEMSKTAVTVEQYAECVIKGGCTEPATGDYCNWGVTGRQLHPVNCVDWDQASKYAKFKGGRLPSESEWEYAATSGGKNQKYPWGNDDPTSELAVMNTNSTMPVCSKPKGNTAQGLCDMAGNVWQWGQDKYQDSYKGTPVDGSAFEGSGSYRVVRGGSFSNDFARLLRADGRCISDPGTRIGNVGFRLVR
jgi:iron(II)-dependent oxidoreductase